jgi:hypothetical protein
LARCSLNRGSAQRRQASALTRPKPSSLIFPAAIICLPALYKGRSISEKTSMLYSKCSHCGAKDSVHEDFMEFRCLKCDWWGTDREKMVYEPEEEWLFGGQVPRRPTME